MYKTAWFFFPDEIFNVPVSSKSLFCITWSSSLKDWLFILAPPPLINLLASPLLLHNSVLQRASIREILSFLDNTTLNFGRSKPSFPFSKVSFAEL
jgi:hypothetical protein